MVQSYMEGYPMFNRQPNPGMIRDMIKDGAIALSFFGVVIFAATVL